MSQQWKNIESYLATLFGHNGERDCSYTEIDTKVSVPYTLSTRAESEHNVSILPKVKQQVKGRTTKRNQIF